MEIVKISASLVLDQKLVPNQKVVSFFTQANQSSATKDVKNAIAQHQQSVSVVYQDFSFQVQIIIIAKNAEPTAKNAQALVFARLASLVLI